MGRSSRRRPFDGRHKNAMHTVSMGDSLPQAKRRKLSYDGSSTAGITSTTKGHDEGGEWQTVRSKTADKRKNHSSRQRNGVETSSPGLYFHHPVHERDPLRINYLRDLVLYVLADGTAPTWIAVKEAKEIERAVVIMLPGLDCDMIGRAEQVTATEVPPIKDGVAQQEATSENGSPVNVHTPADTRNSGTSPTPSPISASNIDWLLTHTLSVKAPADPRGSRVHSPLQAVLMKGSDDSDKKGSTKSSDHSFHAVRTRIIEFVHTVDELRDAEYPLHPALFVSSVDAASEQTRRQTSGQVASDGWFDSKVEDANLILPVASLAAPCDAVSQGLSIYSIDCEMVLTIDEKFSLARVSVISWPDGDVIMDEYVKPSLPIKDYFTQYSGITEQILQDITLTLPDVQSKLLELLTPSTIILGHSLESDLNALKLTHPFIVDTSMIYPHPRGLPLRSSLKFLANKYLKREIQKGGALGHNSVEDAQAVLDLVKLKCEKGPKWGTNEANGDTLFRFLSTKTGRNGQPLTSAMVEYGTPERGLGKDATYTIGCQNDTDVVRGVIRAAGAGSDHDDGTIPARGANFVWGRLRAMEFARGWVTTNTGNNVAAPTSTTNATTITSTTAAAAAAATTKVSLESDNVNKFDTESGATPTSEPEPSTALDSTLVTTLANLSQIRSALPPKTLLILYSGTSDVRPVSRLQAQQAQYKREFKTKKWNELTVQWTDVEEQSLRRAVEDARKGWAWIGVV